MKRIHIYQHLPIVEALRRNVQEGQSILLMSPRSYDARLLVQCCVSSLDETIFDIVHLSVAAEQVGRPVSFRRVWRLIAQPLKFRERLAEDDAGAFTELMLRVQERYARSRRKLVVTVDGAHRGETDAHATVLVALETFLRRCSPAHVSSVIVFAIDDTSTYYSGLNGYLSELYKFEKIFFEAITGHELSAALNGASGPGSPDSQELCDQIANVSGGHPAIAADVLACLLDELARVGKLPADGPEAFRRWALRSPVVAELERQLSQDAEGLTTTALEYVEPTSSEMDTPRPKILRELGVLTRERYGLDLRLSGGVVLELVKRMNAACGRNKGRLGTIIRPRLDKRFIHDALPISPDDIVVLHMSDLHVGPHYRFWLDTPSGIQNDSESRLHELIQADLQKMKLEGRIDALVISGDFVAAGQNIEEFFLAEKLVRKIAEAVKVPVENTLLVPGNHDINWATGSRKNTQVGLANFSAFVRLLGQAEFDGSTLKLVRSRSGANALMLCGLDSTAVESRDAQGIGFVPREVMTTSAQKLKKIRSEISEATPVWAVIHHHPVAATCVGKEEASRGKVTLLANSPELLYWANENSVECILHGHQHQPFINDAYRWPFPTEDAFTSIVTVGAGSVGVSRDQTGPIGTNHYYVLVRKSDETFIRSRILSQTCTSFLPHSDIVLSRAMGTVG